MLLEAMASDGGGGCFSSSSSESNSSNLICSRILKGSRLGPAKSKKIHPWRHARGFAQMPSTFQPLNQTQKHTLKPMVTLHRSSESVLSLDSVHGSQTRQIAIGSQPVVDWCLPLCKRAGAQTWGCGFFSAIWLIHTLTSTRILPPPLALESLSSIFISLFSSA